MTAGAPAFLRTPDVINRYQLSRTTLWRHIKAGRFPAPRRLLHPSPTLFWRLADLEAWEQARAGACSASVGGQPSTVAEAAR